MSDIMREDTIICRCEEVTYGEIKRAISLGLIDPGEVRKYTRTGMGSCQGRTCQREMMHLIKQISGHDGTIDNHLQTRIPAGSCTLGAMASVGEED